MNFLRYSYNIYMNRKLYSDDNNNNNNDGEEDTIHY